MASRKHAILPFLSTPSARRATRGIGAGLEVIQFLSTPSARRATPRDRTKLLHEVGISIHALREEGDDQRDHAPARAGHFYPRPPRGGRLQTTQRASVCVNISIHALREEGDGTTPDDRITYKISIHALREEGDGAWQRPDGPRAISIHALREEGDAQALTY